jgi:uncharacterized protein (TIGR02246 family)
MPAYYLLLSDYLGTGFSRFLGGGHTTVPLSSNSVKDNDSEETMNMTEPATSPAHLMTLFAERARTGDAAGLAALYEPGAVFEPEIGVVLRGLDEFGPALTELAAMRPRIEYDGDPDVVVVDDIAIVSNTWTMTVELPDGIRRREGGVSADVLRRQPEGNWLVLIDQPRGATLDG